MTYGSQYHDSATTISWPPIIININGLLIIVSGIQNSCIFRKQRFTWPYNYYYQYHYILQCIIIISIGWGLWWMVGVMGGEDGWWGGWMGGGDWLISSCTNLHCGCKNMSILSFPNNKNRHDFLFHGSVWKTVLVKLSTGPTTGASICMRWQVGLWGCVRRVPSVLGTLLGKIPQLFWSLARLCNPFRF